MRNIILAVITLFLGGSFADNADAKPFHRHGQDGGQSFSQHRSPQRQEFDRGKHHRHHEMNDNMRRGGPREMKDGMKQGMKDGMKNGMQHKMPPRRRHGMPLKMNNSFKNENFNAEEQDSQMQKSEAMNELKKFLGQDIQTQKSEVMNGLKESFQDHLRDLQEDFE